MLLWVVGLYCSDSQQQSQTPNQRLAATANSWLKYQFQGKWHKTFKNQQKFIWQNILIISVEQTNSTASTPSTSLQCFFSRRHACNPRTGSFGTGEEAWKQRTFWEGHVRMFNDFRMHVLYAKHENIMPRKTSRDSAESREVYVFLSVSTFRPIFSPPLCGFWIPPKYGEHEAAWWRSKGVPQISTKTLDIFKLDLFWRHISHFFF